ncbi:MAG: hypothetical protein AAGF07_03165 [Patescibacteria group bacterium]
MQKVYRIIIVIVLSVSLLYLGYLFGMREKYNSGEDTVEVTASNGAKLNYLTQIERRSVFGAVGVNKSGTPQNFGELLFIQDANGQTQLLFSLQNVPSVVVSSDNTLQKPIPKGLNILMAMRNSDGTDFIYENIGTLSFDAPNKSGLRSGRFSTTINKNFYNTQDPSRSIQRIELRPVDSADENIFTLDNADLPIAVRSRQAPYFWVNL